jgi:hypothetical protein
MINPPRRPQESQPTQFPDWLSEGYKCGYVCLEDWAGFRSVSVCTSSLDVVNVVAWLIRGRWCRVGPGHGTYVVLD